MSFVVSSADLQRHLALVGGVVPTKSVLPIIQNVHCKLNGNQLTLAATDLDNAMQTTLTVEPNGTEAFDVALPSKLLQDTLKALPEQPLTFTLNAERFSVSITSSAGVYEVTGANGADFPTLPQAQETSRIEMPLAVLRQAIDKTLFAASTDELKPALNGMFFDFKKNGATFVATDAHRLVRYRRADITVPKDISFILPQKALRLLGSAAGTADMTVAVEYNKTNAFFSFDTTRLACRLIDARFPDYDNVIPPSSPNKLILNKRELLGSIRRLVIYANKTTHLGRFALEGNKLTVTSEDLDFANRAQEQLACLYDGAPMEIGFNVQLMADLVNNVDTDDVVVELDTPGRAAVFLPSEQAGGANELMLLMPVMLGGAY